jgi:hypothetical protein
MKTNPLRLEFLVTGASTLGALTLLVVALRGPAIGSRDSRWPRWLARLGTELNNTSHSAILVASLIVVSYVIGVFVVQLTFFYPTEKMVGKVRQNHLTGLVRFDRTLYGSCSATVKSSARGALLACLFGAHHCQLADAATVAIADSDPKQDGRDSLARQWEPGRCAFSPARGEEPDWWQHPASLSVRRVFRPPTWNNPRQKDFLDLALTIGRASAAPELAREYEYRRANRQIFVGMLPSVLIAAGAAASAEARARGISGWETCGMLIATAVAAIATVNILYRSARYQEKISQAVILDSAFLERWAAGDSLEGPVA